MRILVGFVAVLLFSRAAAAQTPLVYGEGEPAPPVQAGAWVRGEPVSRFERGRVYLVEFWASWCAASRRAIPRLSALQRAHPDDLTVLAISSRDLQGESLERVTAAVSEQGEAIAYRVAFDDRRRTARAWLDTFDVRSVPTAFLVDRSGVIAWIGNPLWPSGEMEEAAALVLADRFGPGAREALRARYVARLDRVARLEREFEEMDRAAQPARALRLVETLLEANPDAAPEYAVRKFDLLLSTPGGADKAFEFGRAAVGGVLRDDADRLRTVAWTVLEQEGLERRDLDLALRAALRAVEVSRSKDADAMDTLALARARRGEFAEAVEAQRRAVELTPEDHLRADYQERLLEYERSAPKR